MSPPLSLLATRGFTWHTKHTITMSGTNNNGSSSTSGITLKPCILNTSSSNNMLATKANSNSVSDSPVADPGSSSKVRRPSSQWLQCPGEILLQFIIIFLGQGILLISRRWIPEEEWNQVRDDRLRKIDGKASCLSPLNRRGRRRRNRQEPSCEWLRN